MLADRNAESPTVAARIFISYRTADGVDKATALARELGRLFGDDAVFLDKDDLRGGSLWREEVQRTLGARPVLLLLLTPLLLAATGSAGQLRIGEADDPVRRELESALDAGAVVIPVLCDGLPEPPDVRRLPAPFDRIGDRTWRHLRAYDWAGDVERLVADLYALGVPRAVPAVAPPPPRATSRRVWFGAGVAALVAAAGIALWWHGASAPPAGLSGTWQVNVGNDPPMTFELRQQGETLTLTSTPVAIARLPQWAEYRRFWREQSGADLDHVVYRGQGQVRSEPGTPTAIDIALQISSRPGDVPVDSGNLSAAADGSGRRLSGTLWLNSAQADRPAVLIRRPGTSGGD